jgi:hypothetical protein
VFDHPLIQIYEFEHIPVGRDLNLMDEKWMVEFEAALVKSVDGEGESVFDRVLFPSCR